METERSPGLTRHQHRWIAAAIRILTETSPLTMDAIFWFYFPDREFIVGVASLVANREHMRFGSDICQLEVRF